MDPEHRCSGLLGRLLGHQYVAVHDEVRWGPAWLTQLMCRPAAHLDTVGMPRQDEVRIWAGCICRRCGRVVRRGAVST